MEETAALLKSIEDKLAEATALLAKLDVPAATQPLYAEAKRVEALRKQQREVRDNLYEGKERLLRGLLHLISTIKDGAAFPLMGVTYYARRGNQHCSNWFGDNGGGQLRPLNLAEHSEEYNYWGLCASLLAFLKKWRDQGDETPDLSDEIAALKRQCEIATAFAAKLT